jgi:hypothetical protein
LPSDRFSPTPHTSIAASTSSRDTCEISIPSVTRSGRTTGRSTASTAMTVDRNDLEPTGHVATPTAHRTQPTNKINLGYAALSHDRHTLFEMVSAASHLPWLR